MCVIMLNEMTNQPTTVINGSSWLKKRTNMGRISALVFGGMLLASSFLATESLPSISTEKNDLFGKVRGTIHFQNRKHEQCDICLTPGCVKAAASVINNMDLTVDPCDDFYQFACGNFIKTNFVDVDKSIIVDMTKWMSNKLHIILSEPIQPNEQKPFKMMKLLFKSCMDQGKIKNQGLGPIKKILKSLGGWPVLEAEKWNNVDYMWTDNVYKLKNTGFGVNYLIDVSINPDLKNNTIKTISLGQPKLGLSREMLVNGTENPIVAAYYRYMVDIAVLYGADRKRATEELKESLVFEIGLAKISLSQEDQLNQSTVYNPMTFTDLQQKYPSIPWQEYINKLLAPFSTRQDDTIMVESPEYLSGLEILLSNTPKRVQANYMIWRIAAYSVSFLTEQLRKRNLEYNSELGTEKKPRWKECVDISSENFLPVIGSLYVRRFFDKNSKTNVLEMVDGVRMELYKILESSDWMDEKTRKTAIDKAKSITNHIAYPDELLDDSKLNTYYEKVLNKLAIDENDYFTSILNLNKFNSDNIYSKLRQPVNILDWIYYGGMSTTINAFYIPNSNSILVPAGFLQGAIFSSDRPRYMNYGGIGLIIGHEITHGFDTQGKGYDKEGNLVDWWAEETEKRFNERALCLIKQYGNYTDQEIGLKLDGTKTLGENIADNGGVKEAYYAYNVWAKKNGVEPRLPGLQKYTPKQMFWLSAANVWCSKFRPSTLKYLIDNDNHSLNRFRIIGSFSNMKEFSSDFRCPLGSNMNPVNKCQVW